MTQHKPTPEQQVVIDYIRTHPETNVMVDAVAGAAKSTTIEMAARDSIGPQFAPLAVTFNKRNTEEAQGRLPSHFTCKTLNALGHQAWQNARGGKRITLDDDKVFKISMAVVKVDRKDDEDALSTVMQLVRVAKNIGLVPTGAPMSVKGLVEDHPDNWDEIAFVKGLDLRPEYILWARDVLLLSIKEAFQGTIDFADQIYMSVLFGGQYPKHHTVIVDESQDLSPLNHLQLRKLTGTRLIAVGDPHQAIYAFRGADAQSMDNLAAMMGGGVMGEVMRSEADPEGRDFSTAVLPMTPSTSLIGKGKFQRLQLSKSFRVPKAVGKRQRAHVPHFGCMEWLPEGKVEQWPPAPPTIDFEKNEANSTELGWSIDSIPRHGFVICRNNAPLMKLGFAMIKARRPVKILGRDIGAALAGTLLKATGKDKKVPVLECYAKVREWKGKELEKCGDSESKKDIIYDRAECMDVMLDAMEGKGDNQGCAQMIRDMFSDKATSDATLSSGHRIKGMESDWCLHLDPWRVPSKMALKAADRGDPRALVQEHNLQYVIETRTQNTLVMANLEDCLEVGE